MDKATAPEDKDNWDVGWPISGILWVEKFHFSEHPAPPGAEQFYGRDRQRSNFLKDIQLLHAVCPASGNSWQLACCLRCRDSLIAYAERSVWFVMASLPPRM